MESCCSDKLRHVEGVESCVSKEAASLPIRVKEKRNNKEEKSKKKDERHIDQIMKGLVDYDAEKKLNVVCKKYMELLEENRKFSMLLKVTEKKVLMAQKEKDQIESERSKAVLARSRLESLCRELQRQQKATREECAYKIKEEEDKRKEVSAKFQSTLGEVTVLMTETNEKNVKLHEDNIDIQKKFKTVFEEMDSREKLFEEMHRKMKQELLATETKLSKVTLEMAEEKEKLLKEKSHMLIKLTEYQKRIVEMQKIEADLRSQVALYTDKYADFQNALAKSQEVFGGFNSQMEKMSKKIIKLEKENIMWKTRWEKNNNALLDMATEKQTRDAEMITLNKKCGLLQELCKTFQVERTKLIAQIKEKSQNNANECIIEDDNKDNNVNEQSIENDKVSSNDSVQEHMEKVNDDSTVCQKTKAEVNEPVCNVNNNENKETEDDSCLRIINKEDVEKVAEKQVPTVTNKPDEIPDPVDKCAAGCIDAVLPNGGGSQTNTLSNKKNKEGKKKRK